jgi:hypothetical protein
MAWTDRDYKKAFTAGHETNLFVAKEIVSWGIWVRCPPLEFASDASKIVEFSRNEKDVETRAGVIEVKGQGREFTGDPASFPYPSQIVDTVESWESKESKPFAYVFVSNKTRQCLVLPTKSRPTWRVERKFDRFKKRSIDFYVVDKGRLCSMEVLRAHLLSVEVDGVDGERTTDMRF